MLNLIFEKVMIGRKARKENEPWFRWGFRGSDPVGYGSQLGRKHFLNHDGALKKRFAFRRLYPVLSSNNLLLALLGAGQYSGYSLVDRWKG